MEGLQNLDFHAVDIQRDCSRMEEVAGTVASRTREAEKARPKRYRRTNGRPAQLSWGAQSREKIGVGGTQGKETQPL